MKLPALEMIGYQNQDKLPQQLLDAIESMYREIDDKVYADNTHLIDKSVHVKQIATLLQNRFNMNIVFDKKLHLLFPAAVLPFFSDYLRDVNSVKNIGIENYVKLFSFNTNIFRHIKNLEVEKRNILNKIHNKKGFIDLKNARLGGYLSEIKHYLIFDFFLLKQLGIDPSEMVAIILHEVGHAFHGLAYHYKLEKSNATIVDILSEINQNKPDKALFLFKQHFTEKEFKDASVSSNKEIHDFYGKLANAYLGEIKTQMVDAKYDETNFENLADSFSGRFNVYKPLVSGLHKLNKTYAAEINRGGINYASLFVVDLLAHLLVLVLLGPVGVALYLYLLLFVFGSSNTNMTYDFPIERYNRIKNSLINNLKNIDLPKELIVDLLEQYRFITEIIEKTDYFKGTLTHLSDFISPSSGNSNYNIKLQQDIENGLNNVLFVQAASISTLT